MQSKRQIGSRIGKKVRSLANRAIASLSQLASSLMGNAISGNANANGEDRMFPKGSAAPKERCVSAPPPRSRYPLEYRWEKLPMREVRPALRRRSASLSPGAEWHDTGPRDQPFDFSMAIARLTEDIAKRSPYFAHLQTSRILIGYVQARTGEQHGLQARVTPLRFAGGDLVRLRRGMPYQVQRYFEGEREFLYLMTFCLPRYLERDFDDKITTLFHELYHIGPRFDGDLRRHEGRCHLHTHSKVGYDRTMAAYANEYLKQHPDPALLGFLRMDFAQLKQRHGKVVAALVPRPRLVPSAG